MECIICVESFIKKEQIIYCSNCKNYICKSCINEWFKNSFKYNCPFCDYKWTSDFLYNNLNKKFDELYDKIKPFLLEKEKSYIPYTQNYCNAYKCFIKLINLQNQSSNKNPEYDEKLYESISYINEVIQEKNYIEMKLIKFDEKNNSLYLLDNNDISIVDISTNIKICKCLNIQCNGYIMSKSFKCGMCDLIICNKCHLKLDNNHECDENNIKSIKFIELDTKPCPICSVRIHKYEGCDQAFCTQCKTAFSYNSGKIEKGRIHNPHYYEEMQKLKLNINYICDDQDPGFFIYSKKTNDNIVKIINIYNIIHRYYVHNYGILQNKYNSIQYNEINDNENHELDFYKNINNRIIYMVSSDCMSLNDFMYEIYIKYKLSLFYEDVYISMSEYLNIFKIILSNMKEILNIDYSSKSIEHLPIFKNMLDLLKNEVSIYYKNKLADICDFFDMSKEKTLNDFNFLENDNYSFVDIEYNI